MIRSLYAGVSGMKNHQTKLDVISNNISNVNTTGYKSASITFEDMVSQTIKNGSMNDNSSQVGIGSQVGGISTSFTQGAPQFTGRPLDMAIEGNGFFVVRKLNDDGTSQDFLTRDGAFKFNDQGFLVNQSGYQVLDSGGVEIQINGEIATFSVDRQGQITALDDNGVSLLAGDQFIGISFISNPESLDKAGSNMYSASAGTNPPVLADSIDQAGTGARGMVNSNSLEMSNVDLSTEFANMIVTQRGYQANARVITISDQMLEELINLKR